MMAKRTLSATKWTKEKPVGVGCFAQTLLTRRPNLALNELRPALAQRPGAAADMRIPASQDSFGGLEVGGARFSCN